MSKNKVYCSYSIKDEEIVLNTVKLLKNKGVDVWVDQLDIKPGDRWDDVVEKALEESTIFLLFISKASTESSNVMDELSIALNSNKQIIPVLIEECPIPMRLRRNQYADFVNNYENGIELLIQALASPEDLIKHKNNNVENEVIVDDNLQINNKVEDEIIVEDDLQNLTVDYNVFISYNHGDVKTALKIRDLLKNSGIEVTIDQDNMHEGQEIKGFINQSIQNADAVLTLISNKSLKSGWVGVETFDTMFAENQSGKRKLIGCVLDSDFYNYDYTINTIEGLDKEIEKRKEVLIRQINSNVSVTDISSEIDRLRNLRQNFPETMKRLRDFKCIDVSDEEIISHSMEKFVNQLKNAPII